MAQHHEPPVPPPPPADQQAGGGAAVDPARGSGAPADETPAAPAGLQGEGEYVGPVTAFWARTPLRARLIAIVTAMLLAGLGISVALTSTVLSRYLTDQLDTQLNVTASQVVPQAVYAYRETGQAYLPNDYYILAFFPEVGSRPLVSGTTTEKYGIPAITAYTFTQDTIPSGVFTVDGVQDGSGGTSEWRAQYFAFGDGSKITGYVALPLAPVQQTVAQIQRILIVTTLALTVLGATIGYVAIRRSLRPLHTIERTAARIADGDLSQRVPQAPVTTEVGSLARSLNTMLAQIEQSFDAQEASEARMRRFVSDASHELRTPLATVRGYGELYRMGALTTPDAMDDTMRRIEDSATRMGTLVNDLLALARLDEGRPIRSDPVDLVTLARDSVDDLHALDPSRTVRLTALDGVSPPAPVTVTGDEDRLRQVLTNLIGNVAQHTPAGTAAEIAVGPGEDPEQVVLEVRDHGPGIPADQAGRVFERFYRADSSRNRSSGGSGLGMAIVAAIVAAHRGTVSVHETDGGGLTVRAVLPAQSRADDLQEPGAATA